MTLKLVNGVASAILSPERGGLLESLKLKTPTGDAQDMLWLPPDYAMTGSGWPGGGAPILFPLAGRSFHEGLPLQYSLNGKVRHMPLHGFAYGAPWSVTSQAEKSATLELRETPGSLELYPFQFHLRAQYDLSPETLSIALKVVAGKNREPMPVNLGVHPFFKATGRLDITAQHKIRVTPVGGAGKIGPFPENDEERAARTDSLALQSLIFADLKEARAAVIDDQSQLRFGVAWGPNDPFKYIVVFTRPGEGFYCIEPWMGLPDAVHSGLGVTWLKAGEELAATVRLTLSGV